MKVHETKVRCNYAKSKLYQHLPRYLNYIFRIPVNFGRDGHWMTQLYCLLYIHRPNKPQGALARHRAVKGLMKFSWSLFGNCPEEQGIWNLEPRLRSSKTRSPGNRVFWFCTKTWFPVPGAAHVWNKQTWANSEFQDVLKNLTTYSVF